MNSFPAASVPGGSPMMMGGMHGGMPAGMSGGMPGAMAGAMPMSGGMPGGMPMGMSGGMPMQMAGGMAMPMSGGMPAGRGAGMPGGMMMAGAPASAAGMPQPLANAGMGRGMPAGVTGGMPTSGMISGMPPMSGGGGGGQMMPPSSNTTNIPVYVMCRPDKRAQVEQMITRGTGHQVISVPMPGEETAPPTAAPTITSNIKESKLDIIQAPNTGGEFPKLGAPTLSWNPNKMESPNNQYGGLTANANFYNGYNEQKEAVKSRFNTYNTFSSK